MPHIQTLKISNFRNLSSVEIQPSEHFNIFYGDNGAGKTSLLETIYYLGFGRSFRTINSSLLVQNTCQQFSIHAQLNNLSNSVPIGIEKSVNGKSRIRHNGKNINSVAQIAKNLPIQFIAAANHRFFHDGSKRRRQFLDWGLFHVEPFFLARWKEWRHLLKQRNAALKAQLSFREISTWTHALTTLSEQIDCLRKKYLIQLQPVLEGMICLVLSDCSVELVYQSGWDTNLSYAEALEASYKRDRMLGYSTIGPQRADLKLLIEGRPAEHFLSHGQQKLAAYSLYLAQGVLLQEMLGTPPIYLIDDFPAALDLEKRACVANILSDLKAQVLLTGNAVNELRDVVQLKEAQLFHVEHGTCQPVSGSLG